MTVHGNCVSCKYIGPMEVAARDPVEKTFDIECAKCQFILVQSMHEMMQTSSHAYNYLKIREECAATDEICNRNRLKIAQARAWLKAQEERI